MPLFTARDRAFAEAIAGVTYCNAFLPERFEHERRALGRQYVERPRVLSKQDELDDLHPNVERAKIESRRVLENVRAKLAGGTGAEEDELHEGLVLFFLYHDLRAELDALITGKPHGGATAVYRRFDKIFEELRPGLSDRSTKSHYFALCFQIRRAFHHIFRFIVGGSMPAARLRAAVWQSIFTHDMRRYRRALYGRMGDVTTLVGGPSGTGKELVARAIGLSRYIPFDLAQGRFAEDFGRAFLPLNLAALTPTLIESELFGHKRGAFTGAIGDRAGWLESCGPFGTIFLDEIGEIEPALQVKLLRVLQSRRFQRIGESQEREFKGKIIAATNRDLAQRMRQRQFREDLYYRLCADTIATPSLRDQLDDSPGELPVLVQHIATGIAGDAEAESLTREVVLWIEKHLPGNYAWPGNVRELEQCVRNIMIRNAYAAPAERNPAPACPREQFAMEVADGRLSAEELLTRYTSMIHADTGSYQETARRLGVDHRTVKSRLSGEWLEKFGN